MAIQLQSLSINQNEKTVREYIKTPQGSIEVYEPTLDTVNEIIAIQRKNGIDLSDDVVTFTAKSVLTEIFPLTTNIETGNLSDEEIEKIIDNPSIHLLIAQNIVAQIISESNKLYAEQMKANLAAAEGALAQADLINAIPEVFNEHARRSPEVAQNLKVIQEAQERVEELIQEEEKALESQESAPEPVAPEAE